MILLPPHYPLLLRETPAPPNLLYVSGNDALLAQPCIAVVGSRAMTPYGAAACRHIVEACVRSGLVIVSGLATGIDAAAHETALAMHGQTIAVLGSGLDEQVIFPAAHRHLARRIVEQAGAIVSEYPARTIARRHHFIARNRILAGLCLATVVVEAAERSGAINTAHHAVEANRAVFAVPGSIFSSRSRGTHQLIQEGAILLQDPNQIMSELQLSASPTPITSPTAMNPLQRQIVDKLEHGPLHPEQLAQLLTIGTGELQAHLTEMEIQGIVRKNIWLMYEISHR